MRLMMQARQQILTQLPRKITPLLKQRQIPRLLLKPLLIKMEILIIDLRQRRTLNELLHAFHPSLTGVFHSRLDLFLGVPGTEFVEGDRACGGGVRVLVVEGLLRVRRNVRLCARAIS